MKQLKYILIAITAMLLVSCTTPFIVPDPTPDNAVMLQIKDKLAESGAARPSYGWTLWYVPIAVIALLWAWREFIRTPIVCGDGLVRDEKDKNADGIEDPSQQNT